MTQSYPGSGASALRWATATATGAVLDRPGRLYYARLVGTGAASAVLRDGGAADPVILGLATAAAGADDWPRVPVALPFTAGLHATLTGTATLVLGWSPD